MYHVAQLNAAKARYPLDALRAKGPTAAAFNFATTVPPGTSG